MGSVKGTLKPKSVPQQKLRSTVYWIQNYSKSNKISYKKFLPPSQGDPRRWTFLGGVRWEKNSKNFFFQNCSKWPKTSRKTIKIFQNFCLAQPGDHPRVVVKIFFKKFFLTSYNLAFKKPSNVIFAKIPTLASMSP